MKKSFLVRTLSILFCFVFVLSLCACGESVGESTKKKGCEVLGKNGENNFFVLVMKDGEPYKKYEVFTDKIDVKSALEPHNLLKYGKSGNIEYISSICGIKADFDKGEMWQISCNGAATTDISEFDIMCNEVYVFEIVKFQQ